MSFQRKSFFILAFTLFTLFSSCRKNVAIIEGGRYFSEPETGPGSEYITDAGENESATLRRGTLGYKEIAGKKYPALFTLTPSGVACTLLDSLPEVELWSLVEIELVPVTGAQGISRSLSTAKIVSFRKIKNLRSIVEGTQNNWQENKSKFQASARPNSRLQLPEHPEWRLVADEINRMVVVSCQTSDAMWAWDFDFVWTMDKSNLVKIYSHQWFKGE